MATRGDSTYIMTWRFQSSGIFFHSFFATSASSPSVLTSRLPFEIMGQTQGEHMADAKERDRALTLEKEKAFEELDEIEEDVSPLKREYMLRGVTSEEADFLLSLSEKEIKQIYRKVDLRVVPMLAFLYASLQWLSS
jgi:hypothetical protein